MTDTNMTNTKAQRKWEIFNNVRNELLKRDLSNTESYDKSILTLSSATLGFSLTTIHFIAPSGSAGYFFLVKIGWVLLLLSIFSSLIAFLISNKAIKEEIKNAEDYYMHDKKEACNRKNRFSTYNKNLNYATGLIFAVAITTIVAFFGLNV